MNNPTEITVLGAGYVGLTSAVLFAHAGHKVHLVEPNPKRLEVIKSGKSFFYEYGIDTLIKTVIDNGTLLPTDSYEDSVPTSSVVFSCVGTPDNPDGSSNLSYVFASAAETAKHAKPGTVYVQKSTVPVGTGSQVIKQFAESGTQIDYVSNPEFLREGTAVEDTLYFDRVVVGGDNTDATTKVLDIYRSLESHRDQIATLAGVTPVDQTGTYITTSLSSAELIKVTANAFLALKISFANSIAKLADAASADINEVMDAVGADKRIGRAFLNAGRGYGGGCFPKDVSGLISSGLSFGVDLDIMSAAKETNASMPGYIVEKLKNTLGDMQGKKVAVLGLAFKAGTSDVRKSPGVALANSLSLHHAEVTAYDPEANEEAEEELNRSIKLVDSFESAVKNVDAIVVATEWPQLIDRPIADYTQSASVFVDAMNRFSPSVVKQAGLTYIGVGRS